MPHMCLLPRGAGAPRLVNYRANWRGERVFTGTAAVPAACDRGRVACHT